MDNTFNNIDDVIRFNEYLKNNLNSKSEVNYINLITADNNCNKLSIACKMYTYNSLDKRKKRFDDYYCKDKSIIINSDNFYYGLNPQIDEKVIKSEIINKTFLNEDKFNSFIINNQKFFMLHKHNFRYDIRSDAYDYLFKGCILFSASRFAFKLIINDSDYNDFISYVENSDFKYVHQENKISSKNIIYTDNINYSINSQLKTESEDKLLFILGSCSNDFINFLSAKYFVNLINNNLYLSTEKGDSIISLFNNKYYKNIYLVNDHIYYNGVLPRVLEINEIIDNDSEKIKKIVFTIEKTSFFMGYFLDHTYIINHTYLKKYITVSDQIMKSEDLFENKVFNNFQIDNNSFSIINNYLYNSININGIGVSANVTSNNGYYILIKRPTGVTDTNEIYCSANGQAEFFDPNVSYYCESVYEDCPTLSISNKSRNDFEHELSREVLSELGTSVSKNSWYYYGISILGINNQNNSNVNKRRMHFVILAENKIDSTAKEIFDNSKKAVEKFENDKMFFIKHIDKTNMFIYHLNGFALGYKLFLKFKDIIMLFIITFSSVIIATNRIDSLTTIVNHFCIFISTILFITSLINNIKKNSIPSDSIIKVPYKKDEINYNYSSIISKTTNKMNQNKDKTNKINTKNNFHPIAFIMYSLYLTKNYFNKSNNKENKHK